MCVAAHEAINLGLIWHELGYKILNIKSSLGYSSLTQQKFRQLFRKSFLSRSKTFDSYLGNLFY